MPPLTRASLPRDERGASSVEYGLIAFAIAALVVAVVFLFGGAVRDLFTDSCTRIDTTLTSASPSSCGA